MRTRYLAVAAVLGFLALALCAGQYRRGALLGTALSGAAGLLSIEAMARFAARGGKPVQRALAVVVVGFLARILLVALGTALVVRAGESIPAFVLAFFVVYFVLAGLEGAYVQRLGRAR